MNFFALPFPGKYFHRSIFENFDFFGQNDLKPGTFSLLLTYPKYFLNLQTRKVSAGINDHFSFSLSNEKNLTASSISLNMPHDAIIVFKSPKEFEAKIKRDDHFFRLTDNSFFYTGLYPFNDRGHEYDMSFTVSYPTPISLMCQFFRPGGCFGNSIELLPNISIYSIFGKATMKDLSFKLAYSTCDKFITRCLIGFMVEHRGPYFETSMSNTFNTLDFESDQINTDPDDRSVVGSRSKVSASHTLRLNIKFTDMVNLILIGRINAKSKPDLSFVFNWRRKRQESQQRAHKGRKNIPQNQSKEPIDDEYIKKYKAFFYNLQDCNSFPDWKKMKYIKNDDPFSTSLYSLRLKNDAISFGMDFALNNSQSISVYAQYSISTQKCAFQFNLTSLS